jgi:geranylgeranylglycerol-phosphate geranylgeranyltransferase
MFAAYLKLMRPLNGLMTVISVLIGGVLVSKLLAFSGLDIWLAALAAFMISGAGNAINDYTDLEADRVNKPYRPIPSGKVKPLGALVFSLCLFIIGTGIAYAINPVAFLIAGINSLLLIAYSTKLKERMLLGNLVVSYLVGSGFLFGGAALGYPALPFVLFLLALSANMAREIAKDLEDIKGDRLMFLKKAVSKAGNKIAQRFRLDTNGNVQLRYRPRVLSVMAAFCIMLAISVSPAPFMVGMLGWVYLAILVPADIVFLGCIFMLSRHGKKKREYTSISRMIKLGMLLGLLAFLLGALF